MLSDIEIARQAKMLPIGQVARRAGIDEEELDFYGKYKAKISLRAEQTLQSRPDGKLILVTAINPTPAGEGKTTVSVGLAQALAGMGEKAVLALREPSLGPVFGVKGGAAGGGYSQVVPMEDINLHFTGDMHAITAANNLLCALVDNHLQQGNRLGIDPRTVEVKRCMDMNDRALRKIVVGLGGRVNGVVREDGFVITVATEIMAILCLAQDLEDLKERFANILIGYTYQGKPVFARELDAQGAMTALMKDAIQPNLVQTLENTPAIVHGGPFANIAHGCNSVKATKLALKMGDYVVTEAGFGSDLGAEKFLDIKCRAAGLKPDCVVIVATARALKYNGGAERDRLAQPNLKAVEQGLCNLQKHMENMKSYGAPVVVAINRFASDTQEELDAIAGCCRQMECRCAVADVFAQGGKGGTDLAGQVIGACGDPSRYRPLYDLSLPLKEKMRLIAQKIYGAERVTYTKQAEQQIAKMTEMGYGGLPVCVAKTQYSLSDDPSKLGRPQGFAVTVKQAQLKAGAGFVVMLTGDIMTMPGLPKQPAANQIDVDGQQIVGLF